MKYSLLALMLFLLPLVSSCKLLPPFRAPPLEEAVEDIAEYPAPDDWDIEEPWEPLPEIAYPEYPPEEEGEELAAIDPDPDLEEALVPQVALVPEFPPDDFPLDEFPLEPEPVEDVPPVQVPPPPVPVEPELAEPPLPPAPVEPEPAPLPAPPPLAVPPAPVEPEPAVPPPPFLRPPEQAPPPPIVPPPAPPLAEVPGRIPPSADEGEIVFSRIVRATVGQIIEVPFRGTGWVYLGELGNRRGISYDSRRLDTAAGVIVGQSFIFRTEAAGTYILRFFRQDFFRDYIINDHVQIIVEEAPGAVIAGQPGFPLDRGRVIAEPRWPPLATAEMPPQAVDPVTSPAPQDPAVPAPPAPAPADAVAAAPPAIAAMPQAAVPPAPVIPPADSPSDYVRRARDEFDAGRVEPALVILDTMRVRFPAGSDEAWFLYGQLLEANSPSRDIRLSLEFYRRLVSEYPQSHRVLEAQRRIAHLERFFFTIR
ncbi:MAG: hypothetical protein FWC64_08125 [Treponema sp.]|nr:hypothetical protein [Treponema sp.]